MEREIYLCVELLSTRAVFPQDIHNPVRLNLVCSDPDLDTIRQTSLGSCSPCSLELHFIPFLRSNRGSLDGPVSPGECYFNLFYAVHSHATLEGDRNDPEVVFLSNIDLDHVVSWKRVCWDRSKNPHI